MSGPHATYAISVFAIPPLLTAVIILAAGLWLRAKRSSRAATALLVGAAAAAIWEVSLGMMSLSAAPNTAAAWARLGIASLPFLASAADQFAVEIVRASRRRRIATRLAWFGAVQFAIVAMTTNMVTGVHRFTWGFHPAAKTIAGTLSLLFCAALFAMALIEIWRARSRSRGIDRKRLGAFTLSVAIGACVLLDFAGVHGVALYPAGWLALLTSAAIGGYAIARFDLQPVSSPLAPRDVISTMRDVLLVTDREGRIESANPSACAVLGYPATEILGRNVDDLIVPPELLDLGFQRAGLDEPLFRTRSGEVVELAVSRSPIVRDGEPAGQVIIGRDLRHRRLQEREMQRANALLQTTLESTADGILALGANGEIVCWNRRLMEMWRIPRRLLNDAGAADLPEYMAQQLIDPAEFLGSMQAKFDAAMETTIQLQRKDGRRFEQYSAGSAPDRSGLRVWSFRDVTARRRAQEALRMSEARYRLLFEENAAGVCVTTMAGEILDCNATFGHMVGCRRDDLTHRDLAELFDQPEIWTETLRRLPAERVIKGAEARLRRIDGAPIWILQNVAVLTHGADPVVHLTAVDISDRKRAEEQIEFHAYHDLLTQLPNRRLLIDRLEISLLAARRMRRHAAVLFIDLNDFKRVNDTFGHATGDALLIEVAERLRGVVRRTDTVARFGGDEFTIMLPDLAQPEDAVQVAEKVLDQFARPYAISEPPVAISASVGIAVFPRDGEDVDTLLRNADHAMYRAKEVRGNTYRLSA